jgi:hypothetical protein
LRREELFPVRLRADRSADDDARLVKPSMGGRDIVVEAEVPPPPPVVAELVDRADEQRELILPSSPP